MMIYFRRQHTDKRLGRASETEELRAGNQRLKEQVATLETRLRAVYVDAGVAALAGSSFPSPETTIPQVSVPVFLTGVPNPTTTPFPELSAAELQIIAEDGVLDVIKAYRDHTGVDLKTAEAAIDAMR